MHRILAKLKANQFNAVGLFGVGVAGEETSRKREMTGECGIILEVVKPINSFVFGSVTEYVGYIRSYEDNLALLRKSLSDVCNKKDGVNKKALEGKDNQEDITREAASWLKDVRILAKNEELKALMYKDMETAKFVVKMMEKKDLKRSICKESEMQGLVVKVMKKLKEEIEESEDELRKIAEVDYKLVAEVMVEVMKDSIDEFKKLMKEDKRMAVIATRTLKDRDLDKLTEGDKEMEEIVREAENVSDDEELWLNDEDEESNALLTKDPAKIADKNRIKEAARKSILPLRNLLAPLGKLMGDANFKKAVPEAEALKSRLDVIDGLSIKRVGLKKEMDDNTKQHRVACCCCIVSPCNYHGRYQISKAAELMANHIRDDIISKCPQDPVTLRIRTVDLKPIPTQFFNGFNSRTKFVHQIWEKLRNDQVDAVGVFGMGGIGKTTLAKEIHKRSEDISSLRVMVEVSDAPNIKRIQAAIANSIDLPLGEVESVTQRAVKLYNRLISEKEKKVLIILDNVWKRLNLDEIGIPHSCKLLLTTREREVCRVMGVRDINMLEVGVMDANESKELLKSLTGNKVDAAEFKNVVERLLSKCGGLPLAIVATANSLKDKDLASWEKFANDMEKPISSQVSIDYRQIYSILHTSYKFIEVDEKRMFFLLACLSPIGSSVSIKRLLRYGIGLNMFQYVNKLCEAMEQADNWASELMLSSLLLEGDIKGELKVHDIVRAFAISLAAKEEGHMFMVEAIPRWLHIETFQKYTAMSLMSQNEYSRLNGVEANKLQILRLGGDDMSSILADCFFKGMVNLEVLDLSDINLQPRLPESIWKLKKLKTLCIEGCKLGDIKQIGELVNLLVLSLCNSFVEELPNEITELCNLRLLDLSGCTSNKAPLISTDILGSLSNLEGLYLLNNRQAVFEQKSNDEGTRGFLTNRLSYLNALEIKLDRIEHLPIDLQTIQNLEKYRICVGKRWAKKEERHKQFSRVLDFEDIADESGTLENSCLKALLKKADCLGIENCNKFANLVPQLDQEGFRNLSSLCVKSCSEVSYIVKGSKMNDMIAFPRLQSLELDILHRLRMVCDWEAPPGMFSSLQNLKLNNLNGLEYVLPLAFLPLNLTQMDVSSCRLLKFIFIKNEESHVVVELPFLKSLELCLLHNLSSFVGSEMFFDNNNGLQQHQILFDEKIAFPSLEQFTIYGCNNVERLWSKDIYTSGFQNLKDIKIERCDKLSSIGSSSVISVLVQLEALKIVWCDRIREVITLEERNESEIGGQIIRFPKLKYLELGYLPDLRSFCGGGSKLEFPKLKKLELYFLGQMSRLAKLESLPALFHEKTVFPCLEELRSVDDGVRELWNWEALIVKRGSVASIPAPKLQQLTIGGKEGLQQIQSLLFENLSSLTLTDFENDDVFSSKDGFVWTNSQLPKLVELTVKKSKSLKELFAKEDSNALTLFCGQLKKLELRELPTLNLVPLHLFKALTSLILYELEWDYAISADTLGESLKHLQFLEIENCVKMEAVVSNVGLVLEFPRLKKFRLRNLASVKNIFHPLKYEATLRLPSLEVLDIRECKKLEPLWSGFIVAPRLRDIHLSNCENMHHFLMGNEEHAIELPSLQKVGIYVCHTMTSFLARGLAAPKLREVFIIKCSKMQWFLRGYPNHNDDIQLSLLETLVIDRCPYLHAFSLGRLLAPKLNRIYFVNQEYSTLKFDDLNDLLKEIRICPKVRFRNSLI